MQSPTDPPYASHTGEAEIARKAVQHTERARQLYEAGSQLYELICTQQMIGLAKDALSHASSEMQAQAFLGLVGQVLQQTDEFGRRSLALALVQALGESGLLRALWEHTTEEQRKELAAMLITYIRQALQDRYTTADVAKVFLQHASAWLIRDVAAGAAQHPVLDALAGEIKP